MVVFGLDKFPGLCGQDVLFYLDTVLRKEQYAFLSSFVVNLFFWFVFLVCFVLFLKTNSQCCSPNIATVNMTTGLSALIFENM